MSKIEVNTIDNISGSSTLNLGSTNTSTIAAPAGTAFTNMGKIGQVVSTLKTDRFSTTATSETDITGLSVNITPSSTSSKILIMMHLSIGSGQSSGIHFRVKRGTTAVGVGSDGSRTPFGIVSDGGGPSDTNRGHSIGAYTFLDEPSSTDELTYKVSLLQFNGSNTVRINSTTSINGAAYDDIFTSGITAMEVLP